MEKEAKEAELNLRATEHEERVEQQRYVTLLQQQHLCKIFSIICAGSPDSFFAPPAIWQSLASLRFFNL